MVNQLMHIPQDSASDSELTVDVGCRAPDTLNDFLASIDTRAFVMARHTLGNDDDALDAVQDAMLILCERYAQKPAGEWAPLFFRILHNGIMDRLRPRGMQRLRRWFSRSQMFQDGEDSDSSSVDTMDSLPSQSMGPEEIMNGNQQSRRLHEALTSLPMRQREVFMLRRWQGLSVDETAQVLGLSEGSVKTHLSRAVCALSKKVQEEKP